MNNIPPPFLRAIIVYSYLHHVFVTPFKKVGDHNCLFRLTTCVCHSTQEKRGSSIVKVFFQKKNSSSLIFIRIKGNEIHIYDTKYHIQSKPTNGAQYSQTKLSNLSNQFPSQRKKYHNQCSTRRATKSKAPR